LKYRKSSDEQPLIQFSVRCTKQDSLCPGNRSNIHIDTKKYNSEHEELILHKQDSLCPNPSPPICMDFMQNLSSYNKNCVYWIRNSSQIFKEVKTLNWNQPNPKGKRLGAPCISCNPAQAITETDESGWPKNCYDRHACIPKLPIREKTGRTWNSTVNSSGGID